MEDKKPKRQSAAAKKPAAPKKSAATASDAPKKSTRSAVANEPIAEGPVKKTEAKAKSRVQTVAPKKESASKASARKSTVKAAPKPVKKQENKTPFWAPFAKKEAPQPEEREERDDRRREARPSRNSERIERGRSTEPSRSQESNFGQKRPHAQRPSITQPAQKRFTKPRPMSTKAPAPKYRAVEELNEPMRLNKFLAHCGIAARRQAAEFVKQGLVTVNGEVEPNPGYPVQPGDEVRFRGEVVRLEDQKVYILMNKPRDVITTSNDEKGRKTVLDIIGDKVKERIFPVGRLDRMTSGLLLLTNDGDLAKKLSHPSHKVQKVYHVTLDKPFHKADFEKVQKGLMLEDGLAMVDSLHYIETSKIDLEIGLHIGKNRIVRRIFEHLGYEVIKLDRTYYAGLTKKDIGRGHFRHLTEQEVIMLKHFK